MKQAIPYVLLIIAIIYIFSGEYKYIDSCNSQTIDSVISYKLSRNIDIQLNTPEATKTIPPKDNDIIRYLDREDVDTAFIIEEFLTKKIINDILVDDSMLYFEITDTLYKNNILSREINYKLYERTKTITITKPEPLRAALYYGGGIQANINRFDVELGLMFVPKRRRYILKLDYAVYHREISLGVYVKLGRH